MSTHDRLRRVRVTWRLASLPLRMAVTVTAAAALGLAAVLILIRNTTISATSASVLVAVAAGMATVLQQRQVQRRTDTITLITALQNGRLAEADDWMAQRITAAAPVGPDLTATEHTHVMALLGYYEFLAVLAQRGLVDVPLLLDLRGGTMTRCFRLCRSYVTDRRHTIHLGLYSGLEVLTDTYARRVPYAVPTSRPPLDARPPAPVPTETRSARATQEKA